MAEPAPKLDARRPAALAMVAIALSLCGACVAPRHAPPVPPAALAMPESVTASFDDVEDFQIWLDADLDPDTGYGDGFDVLVRGVEIAAPGVIWLRRTEGGGGPGGWGEALMLVRYAIDGNSVTVDLRVGPTSVRWYAEAYRDGKKLDDDSGTVSGSAYATASDFVWCLAGPGAVPFAGCLDVFDTDDDDDIDLGDFAKWVRDG